MIIVRSKLGKILILLAAVIFTASGMQVFASEGGTLSMQKVSGYATGMTDPDGGVMEIVAYNEVNQFAYAVNGRSGKLVILPITDNAVLTADEFDVQSAVTADGFVYGDMTSVAVSPNGEKLAVAIQADDYAEQGKIALFNCHEDGSLTLEAVFDAGVQPDMVVFYDDDTALSADEGEPREGYSDGAADPMGSVTIVHIQAGESSIVDFTAFDSRREELTANGIVLKKGVQPSVDLEPEYIAVADGMAYVTLQEANAIAVLDVADESFTGIYSCGFEDYSTVAVDIDKKDEKYAPKTYESLRGIRMPDGIAAFTSAGKTYLVTANEGDSREWGDYLNEDERNFGKGKTSPTGSITAENSGLGGKVVFFDASDYDGLDENIDYLFGGRSFTVYEVTADGLTEIFTSADDFERITAEQIPENFNCSNDDKTVDDRSGKKGPEPESVIVGEADGRNYAFIALERIGGVMVYDLSDIADIRYAGYINSRDFSEDIAGDVAPEGLAYVRAEKNPYGKNLLLAACEVSGTVAVYTVGDETTVPETPVRELLIDREKLSLYIGASAALNVTVSPAEAAGSAVVFTSDNEAVATVDAQGKVKGVSVGTATITAKSGLAEAAVTITVKRKSSGSGSTVSSYTVKFDTNGGSLLESITVKQNGEVGNIEPPVRDGYTFAGWYTDSTCTEAFSSDTKITKNITLYAKWEKITETGYPENAIVLTVGERTASVWGESRTNDVAPVIRNDRVMLPARFVAENLGAVVTWTEAEPDKAKITTENIEIVLIIGSDTALVNGQVVELDSPTFIENDRTYMPLRWLAEQLGATVTWDESTRSAFIVK